jgi:hypothetical protein
MTLEEWFDEIKGDEEELAAEDPDLCSAIQHYTEAYSELVSMLYERGFEIER